ncbi:CIC_collapsed_G0028300.mRNA.1.CDS.1 [Saccharomyces cerevisiae]|nr:CIC_collapsed_G0028300.mRNA.1.CDS.1 [Saccharomyces cerevisiae]
MVLSLDDWNFFRNRYIPEGVSFDVEPNFVQYTKGVKVPHCHKVSKIITLFNDESNDNKKRTIDMNYTKCLARGMLRDEKQFVKVNDKSQVDNNSVNHDSSQSFTLSNAELDDILGSDSDF